MNLERLSQAPASIPAPVSRRKFVKTASLAVGGGAGLPAATAQSHPDAELFAACAHCLAQFKKWNAPGMTDDWRDSFKDAEEAMEVVAGMPAHTFAGIAGKFSTLEADSFSERGFWSLSECGKGVMESIIADVQRLA